MLPGNIFWASVRLVKRQASETHPVVFFKTLTKNENDGVLVFGGSSKLDESFDLLHTIDFPGPRYKRLHHFGLDSKTYFYWEFFQLIYPVQYKSPARYSLHEDDLLSLLESAYLI